jgi:phage shock protein PspC (stress-responsive transcriptional regulator)
MNKRLYKDEKNGMIGGVCQGLAEHFDADVSLIRILAVLSIFVSGLGLIAYLAAWIILPTKEEVLKERKKPSKKKKSKN